MCSFIWQDALKDAHFKLSKKVYTNLVRFICFMIELSGQVCCPQPPDIQRCPKYSTGEIMPSLPHIRQQFHLIIGWLTLFTLLNISANVLQPAGSSLNSKSHHWWKSSAARPAWNIKEQQYRKGELVTLLIKSIWNYTGHHYSSAITLMRT